MAPDLDAILADLLADPDPAGLPPAALRLARRVPAVRAAFDPRLRDPLHRALCGLGPPPVETALDRRVYAAVAALEGGLAPPPAALAAALEDEARQVPELWPLAARVHVAASPAREAQARRLLSEQELPYVFPGELHPLQVDVLAAGDRVMPALHVDWARKLTDLAADALVLDARALGLWFWPVLRALPADRLARPVAALARARRLPPGGRGLAAAYAWRVGQPWAPALEAGDATDGRVAALAIVGDRRA